MLFSVKLLEIVLLYQNMFSCHQTEEKSNHLSGADCRPDMFLQPGDSWLSNVTQTL